MLRCCVGREKLAAVRPPLAAVHHPSMIWDLGCVMVAVIQQYRDSDLRPNTLPPHDLCMIYDYAVYLCDLCCMMCDATEWRGRS